MSDTEAAVRAAAIGLLSGLEALKACRIDTDGRGWHVVGGWPFAAAACPACRMRVALKAKEAGDG